MSSYLLTVKDWLENNTSLVQASSSVFTLIIIFFTLIFTIVYVRATQKLVQLPYKSFVKPTHIKIGNSLEIWFIKVKNFGPGLALNIRLSTAVTSITRFEDKSVCSKRQLAMAEGPTEIQPGSEGSFLVTGFEVFDDPVYICWESITGKKYRSAWRAYGKRRQIIVPANIYIRVKYGIKVVCLFFKLPYSYSLFLKAKLSDNKMLQSKLLIRLSSVESLSYDYLGDDTVKTDDEIKKILWKMNKRQLIHFDGDESSISNKGIGLLMKQMKKEKEVFR